MTPTHPDRLDQVESRLDKITGAIEALTEQVKESNLKVDLYQKASQQVVNLAFGLLSVAALAIIVPALTSTLLNK